MNRSNTTAETGDSSAGKEGFANTLVQVVGAQVDGADPAEAMDKLLGGFAVELFGNCDGDGKAADSVERGRNDAAVQTAVLIVTDQFGTHGKNQRRGTRLARNDLEAKQLIETDAMLEHIAQMGFEASLFFR